MAPAETIATALGGRRAGVGWLARCPAHDDRTPSLSIRDADDGKVLVHCHAGCDQERVIATLRACGLWAKNGSRALHLPSPPTLRFHAGLKHPSGGIWPVMVALITRGIDDAPLAIHRTFLARHGSGKAPVEPAKMMLGPCRGGAVRLAKHGYGLMVGEGLETCLAAMQATGRRAWASLSTSGLRALDLPEDVRDVTVLTDGDEPGEVAAWECARRWKREGRRVRIARPPRGSDFNDVLLGRVPGFTDSAA